jgi:hypothetical protein
MHRLQAFYGINISNNKCEKKISISFAQSEKKYILF